MKRATKYLAVLMVVALLLAGTAVMMAQAQTKDSEADLYTAWYNEKDAAKKVDLAQKYLEKYPSGQYAAYMKQTVIGYKFQQFQTAMEKQNTADLFRIAKEFLAEKNEGIESVTFLFWPALESNRLTMKRDYQYSKEGREFTQQAITEIEGGKIPAISGQGKVGGLRKEQIPGPDVSKPWSDRRPRQVAGSSGSRAAESPGA